MLDRTPPAFPAAAFLQPWPPKNIVSLTAFNATLPALQAVLGLSLPATPRRVAFQGVDYLWSGPNAWLAISEQNTLAETLCAKAQNLAAVTEQTDGLFVIRVIGPEIRAILKKLVPIDLHETAFAPDAVALTLAAHINVRLWQEDDGAFALGCLRSFSGALYHALVEAAAFL